MTTRQELARISPELVLFGIGRASGTWGWRWIPRFFCRLFYFYINPIISAITGPVYLFCLPAVHPDPRKSLNDRLVNLNYLGFILSARMRDFHYGIIFAGNLWQWSDSCAIFDGSTLSMVSSLLFMDCNKPIAPSHLPRPGRSPPSTQVPNTYPMSHHHHLHQYM